MKTNNRRHLATLVGTAVFGAVAFIVMFYEFPIIPGFSFLKIDFSDVILFLVFQLYGLRSGIGATLIRGVLHYIQTGGDAGYPIGDLASVISTLSLLLPIYFLFQRRKDLVGRLQAFAAGTVSLTLVMTVTNAVILLPLYAAVMNFTVASVSQYLLLGIVPFNLIKGCVVSVAIAGVWQVAQRLPFMKRH